MYLLRLTAYGVDSPQLIVQYGEPCERWINDSIVTYHDQVYCTYKIDGDPTERKLAVICKNDAELFANLDALLRLGYNDASRREYAAECLRTQSGKVWKYKLNRDKSRQAKWFVGGNTGRLCASKLASASFELSLLSIDGADHATLFAQLRELYGMELLLGKSVDVLISHQAGWKRVPLADRAPVMQVRTSSEGNSNYDVRKLMRSLQTSF